MRFASAFAAVVFIESSSCALSSIASANANTPLPTIDLGYQLQRATVYNTTGNYYNFSNVRYARPPTGNLRFREPLPPTVNHSQVFTGETGRICSQSTTNLTSIIEQYLPQYILRNKNNWLPSDFKSAANSTLAKDPRSTEDCLFLDVLVPQKIFEAREKRKSPVLVWIHGGGYTSGSKVDSGNPAGLISRSTNGSSIVYIAINYRLGAFGWLSGPSFQGSGGAVNAGLYDQRLALKWIQEHIHKFGGDPKQVTVMGESAGGGSTMSQILAFGGDRPVPFQRAILQSPAIKPYPSSIVQEDTFQTFLGLLNASTLDQARTLPSEKLQAANARQVYNSPYGQYTYGAVQDGEFLPQTPGVLLASGGYAKSLQIMVGHNSNEGLFFASPFISNNTAFDENIFSWMPSLRGFPKTVSYIVNDLYPPIFNNTAKYGYKDQISRDVAFTGDLQINCNAFDLASTFRNRSYAYEFAVNPGIHGEDLPYTFFNGPDGSTDGALAILLQRGITQFVEKGNPNGGNGTTFPMYGDSDELVVLKVNQTRVMKDPTASERCRFWNKGLYF